VRTRVTFSRKPSQLNSEIIPFGSRCFTIYQRGDVTKSSWFFRVYLRDEGRFYRKSLKTTSRRAAIQLGEEEFLALRAKVDSGQRILALSLRELVRRFSLHMEEQVRQDQIAVKTWQSQRYRLTLGCDFLKTVYPSGLDTKIGGIDGSVFHGYLKWRQQNVVRKKRTIRRDVVRDELLVIRKMFLYAQTEHLCSAKTIPTWDIVVEKEGPKRARITHTHFKDFLNITAAWVKEADGPRDNYHRRLLMYIAGIVAQTGLRSGEVFGLKNKDVEGRGKHERLITIRPETSKVRRGRQVFVPYMLSGWIEKYQRFKEPNNFVFCPYDNGDRSARDVFYHLYKSLRVRLKEIELDWFDLYHLRHWWITTRLLAEESISLVALASGTSVKEIEATYSHVTTELLTKRLNQKKLVWKQDGSYEVVKLLEQG
jgi:integrase